MNERGLLNNTKLLKALFNKYINATFFLILRNYNMIDDKIVVGLFIESETEDGRAYVRDDIRKFLPIEITHEISCNGLIPFKTFKSLGYKIANLMCREVVMIHQSGHGDQSLADFSLHRFKPKNFVLN